MFGKLTVRGSAATIVWSYHTAAVLGAWAILKQETRGKPPTWRLAARVVQADAFKCRQGPLWFTALHSKGQWCWKIHALELGAGKVHAVLGPPEQ